LLAVAVAFTVVVSGCAKTEQTTEPTQKAIDVSGLQEDKEPTYRPVKMSAAKRNAKKHFQQPMFYPITMQKVCLGHI
jgi:hypothetical protein